MDDKREGLDIEIQDLLSEMDTQASFTTEVKKQPKVVKVEGNGNNNGEDEIEEESEEQSKMGILVEKLVDRQKQIDA